jgi:hypothetical protein
VARRSRGGRPVPTRAKRATSLGLYVTALAHRALWRSGVQLGGNALDGVSKGFNDNALAAASWRTGALRDPNKAGRSQGCPAMEPVAAAAAASLGRRCSSSPDKN